MDTTTTINPMLLLTEKSIDERLMDFKVEILQKIESGEITTDRALNVAYYMTNCPLIDPTLPSLSDGQLQELKGSDDFDAIWFYNHPHVDSVHKKIADHSGRAVLIFKEGHEMNKDLKNPATRNIEAALMLDESYDVLFSLRNDSIVNGVSLDLAIGEAIVNGAIKNGFSRAIEGLPQYNEEENGFLREVARIGFPVYMTGKLIEEAIHEIYQIPRFSSSSH